MNGKKVNNEVNSTENQNTESNIFYNINTNKFIKISKHDIPKDDKSDYNYNEMKRILDLRLKIFDDKIKNIYNEISSKIEKNENIKNINKKSENIPSTSFDYNFVKEEIKDEINKSLDEKVKNNLSENINYTNLNNNITIIDEKKEILDLKSSIEKIINEQKEKIQNTQNKNIEENINAINNKINYESSNIRKLEYELNIVKSMLEGENKGNEKDGNNQTVNLHSQLIKKSSDGLFKVNEKIDNINKNILNMIKKDLKIESTKILEEFKKDLKLSITKIEGQLQDKVDKFGLMEFEKKLNS